MAALETAAARVASVIVLSVCVSAHEGLKIVSPGTTEARNAAMKLMRTRLATLGELTLAGKDVRNVSTAGLNRDGSYKKALPRIARYGGPGKNVDGKLKAQYKAHIKYLNELLKIAYSCRGKTDDRAAVQRRALVLSSLTWWFDNGYPPPKPVYHLTFSYHSPKGLVAGLLDLIGNVLLVDGQGWEITARDRMLRRKMLAYSRHMITSSPQTRGPNWSFRWPNCMRHVMFANDPGVMDEFMAVQARSLEFDPYGLVCRDGVWPDWSLTHHGDNNYWGMYGAAWLSRTIGLGKIIKGTPWEYTPEQVHFIENSLLDGFRWCLYRGGVEYTTAPKRASYLMARTEGVAASMKETVREFLEVYGDKMQRRAEVEHWMKNIDVSVSPDDDTKTTEFSGHRLFWHTEYQVHRRSNYFIAVRRCSRRTRGPEGSAYKPASGLHLHYGSGYTAILRRGDEFRLSRLGWDFQAMPGTTVERNGQTSSGKSGSTVRGMNMISGGVTDGDYGAGIVDFRIGRMGSGRNWTLINGAGAWKGNFFFDREMVNLGQNIRRIAPGRNEIWTTINNIQRRSGIVYSLDGMKPTEIPQSGSADLKLNVRTTAWVWHDRIGYLIINQGASPANLHLKAGPRPVHKVLISDKNYRQLLGKGATTIDMFQLWLNHGANPRNDSYCYYVVMDVSAEEMVRYTRSPGAIVVRNSGGIQAVENRQLGITYAAFYQPGAVTFADGRSIGVDLPLLVMLRKQKDDNLAVSVANPKYRGLMLEAEAAKPGQTIGELVTSPVTVKLRGFGVPGDCLSFRLPTQRGYEGQTVKLQ